jgi:hypothetical protein
MTNVQPGRYRHYKGNEYTVLGVARHSETLEELVVYRQEYGDHGLWVRPAAMFAETVVVDGKTVPRFAAVSAEPADDPGTTLRLSLPNGGPLQQFVVSQPGLDDIRHVAGLFLEFLHEFLVVSIDGAAGEIQQILGFVAPRLEPIWSRGDRAVEQPFQPVELVVCLTHGVSVTSFRGSCPIPMSPSRG